MAVSKEEGLIIFDFDDEEDDINVSEKAVSEEKRQAFDKDESKSPPVESDDDMRDEICSLLNKFGDNANNSLLEKRRRIQMYSQMISKESSYKMKEVWKTKQKQLLKVNHKYYQQFMDLFKQWDLDKQRYEKQQEYLITSMQTLWRRISSLFLRKTESEETPQEWFQDNSKFKSIQGVVTSLCKDHGWINESISFNTDANNANTPLKIGTNVLALVEENQGTHVLKAIKMVLTLQNKQPAVAGSSSNDDWIADHFSADIMTGNNPLKAEKKLPAAVEEQSTPGVNAVTVDAFSDDHGEEPSESHMRVLLGCITSLLGDVDYNGDEFSFSLDIACKDFQPYNGDLVEIEFSEEQDTQSRKAILVKPLKHCHVNEVRVTKTDGRSGVLEDTIFFTLDSLKLPSRYVPQPDDVVNVVAVQSIQPSYFWRAVSMTPVQVV